jgi:hypothetical protein
MNSLIFSVADLMELIISSAMKKLLGDAGNVKSLADKMFI